MTQCRTRLSQYLSLKYWKAIAIFCCIGTVATEKVVLQLLRSKCIPILLYGLEACPLKKADLNVLDFVVNRFFMKLFRTNNIKWSKNVSRISHYLVKC